MSLQVVGIGEIVWDIFPSHRRLGGAPYNYTFHCAQMSAQATIVSSIGTDDLGHEIKTAAVRARIETTCLQESTLYPTGSVKVTLHSGKPEYEICLSAAWDYLTYNSELSHLALKTDAVCFGTLGQRSEISRKTIQAFVAACPESALKIFDINLRQHFFSKELIEDSLRLANILKISDEELVVLEPMFGLSGAPKDQLKQLMTHFDLRLIAYTRGDDGSLLITENEIAEHNGLHGEVADTVGAGDSFTAALSMGLLRKWPLEQISEYANRIASFVCSQKGATPALPKEIIKGAVYA